MKKFAMILTGLVTLMNLWSMVPANAGESCSIEGTDFLGYALRINEPPVNSDNGTNNVPDFTLENISSESGGMEIKKFTLTIGDTNYNYDFVRSQTAIEDSGSTLEFTPNSPDLVNDDDKMIETVDYDFSGFDPGDIFRFEADVDPDVGPSPPTLDYRKILFPNAVVTVEFSNGATLSQTLAPVDTGKATYQFVQIGGN